MRLARVLNSPWFSIVVPALVGLVFTGICVAVFGRYGWSLFLGVPLLVSFLSGFCSAFRRRVPWGYAYGVSLVSILALGAVILLFALDGLICLLMALPLALGLALVGATFGWSVGSACVGKPRDGAVLLLLLAFPGLVAFESAAAPPVPMRDVTTRVIVNAPTQEVWRTVVAFPKITDPPTGVFRWGIAYPIEARIEGIGVGAVRHCIFSTGPFVEPITHWEEPNWLAFDVEKSPVPMKEVSLYEEVDAPHLHGHMVSHRGEFRIKEQDGKVVLEGTTWYTHTLEPQWYWGPISDYLIHRIHERVLGHIQRVVERK